MAYGNCDKYRTIASFTTNANDPERASWDLTPYKTAGVGTPGGKWRLIELGYHDVKPEGKISADGTLVSYDYVEPAEPTRSVTPCGLPDRFDSSESYDGYMALQVADPDPECKTCPCPEYEKEEKCKCQQ